MSKKQAVLKKQAFSEERPEKEGVNPKVDIVFKKLFGVPENNDLLISLINAVVSQEDQVKTVKILNPYNSVNFKGDKMSIVDIKAEGHNGKLYNIELQISDEGDYDKRALYYWAKLYADQLSEGHNYDKLNKTIGIHILNFTSIPLAEKYHNVFHLQEKNSKLHCFKDIELHTIELAKFDKTLYAKGPFNAPEILHRLLPNIKTALDRWATFLARHDLLNAKALPKELKDPSLKKALHVVETMNFNKIERELYEGQLKWLRMEASVIKKVEAKSEAKGEEKGMAKGRTKEKIAIAKNLLAKNFDIQDIAEATGLDPQKVEDLKKGLQAVEGFF